MSNTPIKLDKIKQDFNRIKKDFDYLVVEGAGGIVCPFNIKENLLLPDIIKALELDIIIVASAQLGGINSAVLTVEYAKQKGINVKGIVLNQYNDNDIMQKDNKLQIERLANVKTLAAVKANAESIDLSQIIPAFKEI